MSVVQWEESARDELADVWVTQPRMSETSFSKSWKSWSATWPGTRWSSGNRGSAEFGSRFVRPSSSGSTCPGMNQSFASSVLLARPRTDQIGTARPRCILSDGSLS
jgi:hypothetical protein